MNYKKKYYKHHGLIESDFLACKICGKKAVNLHHVIYRSHNGNDEPENLIPLCFNCHSGHHDRNNPTTEQLIKANE